MFFVRGKVLKAMAADVEWRKRMDEVRTVVELQQAIAEYAKLAGYKVVEVPA